MISLVCNNIIDKNPQTICGGVRGGGTRMTTLDRDGEIHIDINHKSKRNVFVFKNKTLTCVLVCVDFPRLPSGLIFGSISKNQPT